MVSETEHTELLEALIKNAFRFLVRSIGGVSEDQHLAIADFTIAMELLLKSVLFHEHWALVAENPHEVTWEKLKGGSVPTLGGTKLVKAIPKITGVPIPAALSQLVEHRNRVIHFAPATDVGTVAAEMWRVWHEMHRLLNRQWKATFAKHMWSIANIETRFALFTEYLQVRFDALPAEQKSGADVMVCTTCGFNSCTRGKESSRLVSSDCAVCHQNGNLILCDQCGKWVPLRYDDPHCSQCMHEIKVQDIYEELNRKPDLKPKDLVNAPGSPACPNCSGETAPWHAGWLCIRCSQEYSSAYHCNNCGHYWAGFQRSDEVACPACSGFGVSAFGSSPFGSSPFGS